MKNHIKTTCSCGPNQICKLCYVEEPTENDIEKDCIEYAENVPSCLITKTSTTGRKKGKTWIKAKVSERKGKADTVLCFHGFYIEVEFKKPGGKQSQDQKDREQEVIEAGGQYWLIDNLDEFIFKIGTFKW